MPKPIKVIACICTIDGRPDHRILKRVQDAATYSSQSGISTTIQITTEPYCVSLSRNRGVMAFLKDPDATHLFFCDNDLHIQKDAINLLLSLDVPVAGGCYPSVKVDKDNHCQIYPYLILQRNKGWVANWFDGPLEVEIAGSGCMLIKREVLEALDYPWFRWVEKPDFDAHDIDTVSDDVDFCRRVRAEGFRVVAHGNVRCSHFKNLDISNLIHADTTININWHGPITLAQQKEAADAIQSSGQGSPSEAKGQVGPQKDSPDSSKGQEARCRPEYQRQAQLDRAFNL